MGQACCRSKSADASPEHVRKADAGTPGSGVPGQAPDKPGDDLSSGPSRRKLSEADVLASLASQAIADSDVSSLSSGEVDDDFMSARSEFSMRSQSLSDWGDGPLTRGRSGSMEEARKRKVWSGVVCDER